MPTDKEKELRKHFRNMRKGFKVFPAEVKDVNEANQTCTVVAIESGLEYYDVRVRSKVAGNDTGWYLIPQVGSEVLVAPVNGSDPALFIVMFQQIEKAVLQAGTIIQLMDGSKGGIPVTADIVTRLNLIESAVNDIVSAIQGGVPGSSDGGAALKSSIVASLPSSLADTVNSDIENEDVTHGNKGY